ncbi:hypothetical protein ABK040_015232 [Willaertia magna]
MLNNLVDNNNNNNSDNEMIIDHEVLSIIDNNSSTTFNINNNNNNNDNIFNFYNFEQQINNLKDDYSRPIIINFNNKINNLYFQLLDCNYFIMKNEINNKPIINLYGITKEGYSVTCHVSDYLPYLYIELFEDLNNLNNFKEVLNLEILNKINLLNNNNLNDNLNNDNFNDKEFLIGFEIIYKKKFINYNSKNKNTKFLKITTNLPSNITIIKEILENGIFIPELNKIQQFTTFESNISFILKFLIDLNLNISDWIKLKVRNDSLNNDNNLNNFTKLTHSQIEIDISFKDILNYSKQYITNIVNKEQLLSNKQIIDNNKENDDFNYSSSTIAPLRILSLKIECDKTLINNNQNQQQNNSSIITTIINNVIIHNSNQSLSKNKLKEEEENQEDFVKTIFCLNHYCPNIVKEMLAIMNSSSVEIYSFENEIEMLIAWKEFIIKLDPDFIIGYNLNVSLQNLLNRANNCLNLKNYCLGRTILENNLKNIKEKELNINGRIVIDIKKYILQKYKLNNYNLTSICTHFLKIEKEDYNNTTILNLLNSNNSKDKKRLFSYYLKETNLIIKLFNKLLILYNLFESAKINGTLIKDYNNLQKKGISLLLRITKEEGYLIPSKSTEQQQLLNNDLFYGSYEMSPVTGCYNEMPISVINFKYLYPSIIIKYNLCFTTFLNEETIEELIINQKELKEYEKTPSNHYFVKSTLQKGIIPLLLEKLFSLMKETTNEIYTTINNNSLKKERMIIRESVLKTSINSIYGFIGSTTNNFLNSSLNGNKIASIVVNYGNEMVKRAKQLIEQEYKQLLVSSSTINTTNTINTTISFVTNTTFNENCNDNNVTMSNIDNNISPKVIYCDTDSLMVNFHTNNVKMAFTLGKIISNEISKRIELKNSLVCEKIYFPLIIFSSRRYAGCVWKEEEKENLKNYIERDDNKQQLVEKQEIVMKGLVRNDLCPLVKQVVNTTLQFLLINRNVNAAINYVKTILSDLLMNRIDIYLLTFTKTITTNNINTKYNNNFIQTNKLQFERMKQRNTLMNSPDESTSTTIHYVVLQGNLFEDPIYAIENNLQIDHKYYIDKQLKIILTRIFEPIIGSNNAVESILFSGDHMRTISIKAPVSSSFGITMFIKKTMTCLHCKERIGNDTNNNGKNAVCKDCLMKGFKSIAYENSLKKKNDCEDLLNRALKCCQNCQGSLIEDVLCTNKDCPVFYARKKVSLELAKANEELNRFD